MESGGLVPSTVLKHDDEEVYITKKLFKWHKVGKKIPPPPPHRFLLQLVSLADRRVTRLSQSEA